MAGNTLVSASSVEKGFEGNGGNVEAAKKVGAKVAERALQKGMAATSITAESRHWQTAPARAA